MVRRGFPGGASGKEPACQCRRHKRRRFSPWVGKIPWRRRWQPTPVFLPGESHGQRSLVVYSPWGHKESDMTEATSCARSKDSGQAWSSTCSNTVLPPDLITFGNHRPIEWGPGYLFKCAHSFYIGELSKLGLWRLNKMKCNSTEAPQKACFLLFLWNLSMKK